MTGNTLPPINKKKSPFFGLQVTQKLFSNLMIKPTPNSYNSKIFHKQTAHSHAYTD